MPLLVNSVPNLAQGVSQQPDSLRYPGQCDEQVNAWATVVEGLVKRPNTNFVSKVSTSSGAGLFTHFVKRDEDNKYCVTVSLGGVGVIDLDSGNNISVATTSIATSYLSGISSPLTDIRALTVADYTFLVNKTKTVAKDSDAYSGIPEKEALIVVKLGDYEKYYSIYIDDTLVPFTTLHGGHNNPGSFSATYLSGDQSQKGADTEVIAKDLASLISAQYSTTRTGITDISFTSGTGNTGWLEGDIKITSDTRVFGFGGAPTGAFLAKSASKYPKRVEFVVKQTVSGETNESAKGFCEVLDGVITDFIFTNNGNDYNTDTATNPLSVVLSQKAFYNGSWRLIHGNTPVAPDTITPTAPTAGNIAPFIVEVEGSIIRLRKTINVSNGGTNYLLKEQHVATSDNEPGSGQSWTDFWEETSSTAGVTAWVSGTVYSKGTDFRVRSTDGLSNEGLGVVYKEVSSITDLPKQCFNNFVVKVLGDADIDQDDYYVRFTTKDKEKFGEGSWVETVGWEQDENKAGVFGGIQTKLDATTMPVTLVPVVSLGNIVSFKLQTPQEDVIAIPPNEIGWRTRQAGDDNTNPFPSFVGTTINDVFFFKNRLGFLTDSNVIFSEADEYFNFFRTTTQQLLDSAPIDVGLSHTKVARLQYAKAFQEKLMLFSDSTQFVLRGSDVLSPKTVAISPVSEYDTTDNVEPLVLGNYIYFPFNRDKYVGMYEYYVDSNTEVFEAQEITEHVPKYIPSTIRMMAGSTTQNTVLVQSLAEQDSLYVYKYFWSGKEKIQSAWQKFTIGGNDPIRGFDFVDSTLYLLIDHDSELYLEKLVLEEGYVDKGDGASLGEYFGWDSAYPILLDCNTSYFEGVTHQYDAVNNVTTLSNIPLPVSADDVTNDVIQVWSKYGRKYNFTRVDDSTITIEGTLYDYVTYNGTIYKCNLSHDSGFRDKGTNLIDIYKPDGSFGSTVWSTLTGDEAARVTTAPDWQQDVWYEGYENFVIGYAYNMLYKFSDQTLKQPTEKGGRSASNYTYQTLRTGSLNYTDTGFFQVEVTPKHRDSYYYPFNSNLLGEGSLVNKFTPQDGHFRFPIQAQPGQVDIKITSSSALPVKLLGAEFESMIIPRTRRYGA